MPYRGGIETVLQRCEDLRLEVERVEECAVHAWEDVLRTRLEHLAIRGPERGLVRRADVAIAVSCAVLITFVLGLQMLLR